jgi:adenine deaminase
LRAQLSGTDAAVIPYGDNDKQFHTYVNMGMTSLFAIQTVTINAAELLGWSDRVGALEPGKLADIIAVRGNPLQNVRTLEHVVFVMKDGRWTRTSADVVIRLRVFFVHPERSKGALLWRVLEWAAFGWRRPSGLRSSNHSCRL